MIQTGCLNLKPSRISRRTVFCSATEVSFCYLLFFLCLSLCHFHFLSLPLMCPFATSPDREVMLFIIAVRAFTFALVLAGATELK